MASRWRVGDSIGIHGKVCEIRESTDSLAYVLYSEERQETLFAKTPRAEVIARHPQLVERYERAVRRWQRVPPHQNVLKGGYFLPNEEIPFLYLEYICAGHLGELVSTPRLTDDIRQVLRFAIQLSEGLAHAAINGLHVHGNLKPSNCLLTEDGTLKVTDFGLGEQLKREDGAAPAETALNPYFAPELADGARGPDTRSDVYAFGLILYELATGQRPYTPSEWVKLISRQNIKLPSLAVHGIAGDAAPLTALNALFQQCLAVNPDQRPSGFAEVAQRLRHLYQRLAGTSAPTPLVGRELEAHRLLVEGEGVGHLGYCAEELVYIDRALTAAPHMHLAWSNKGAALSTLERDEDALVCLEHALILRPNSPAALTRRGHTLMKLKRYEEALGCLKKALSIDPHSATAWVKKGECLSYLGKEGDDECYKQALELAPRSEAAWLEKRDRIPLHNRVSIGCLRKGSALAGRSRFEEALACFERATQLSPDWEDAWEFKGDVLLKLKCYHEAVEAFAKALTLKPEDDELLTKQGGALRAAGRLPEALHCFERVLTRNCNKVLALVGMAFVLGDSGHHAEAIKYCDRALKVEPNNGKVWLLQAMSWDKLDRRNMADHCYKMAERLGAL